MALFAIWHDDAAEQPAAQLHAALLADAHIVPERTLARAIETGGGRWQLSAFVTATHYYSADAQVWIDPAGGCCVIHGVIWQAGGVLDAEAVGHMLDRPCVKLPADVMGEYAIARLHTDGIVEAFGDPAGLHQLFHGDAAIVSNRAGLAALVAGKDQPETNACLWLGAIGYRVGTASSWAGIRQVPQGARLMASAAGSRIDLPAPATPDQRGFAHGGSALLAQGLEQAKAAILLAAGDGTLDLPITGGKDSRVVLAIALAAGLHERLSLFTRGYAGHPDVVVGALIADRIGAPHRREPPLGSDIPADLLPADFMRLLKTIAWQSDGGMGGWDNISAHNSGRETLVSGHLGEVLKAYAKRMPEGPLDPIAMVRLQAPFDPLDVLRPPARERLAAQLADGMAAARVAGAAEDDLPDLFYWQNRVPNWLGGIRGIKSFERQPILPVGVPALMALAFRMSAAERKAELAHFKLIEAGAPELIDLPFAHQNWHPSLGAPVIAPVLTAAGSALFGSWQWSVNRVPGVRAALAALFAETDIPLWDDVDRKRLIEALHYRRFDYLDLISVLGFAVAVIHQAGLGAKVKLGGEPSVQAVDGASLPPVTGHVDVVAIEGDRILIDGWAQAPDWPGATVAVEARLDGKLVAITAAEGHRPDLAAAGIGDGRHAFALRFDAALLENAQRLTVAAFGHVQPLTGGDRSLVDQPLLRDP